MTDDVMTDDSLREIARQFANGYDVKAIAPLGNGNINSTFLVTVDLTTDPASESAERAASRFVLQCINTQVFHQPELVIQNITTLSSHLSSHLSNHLSEHLDDHPGQSVIKPARRWETPCILPTQQGEHFWTDAAGKYWRAISFIEGAHVLETVENATHAKEIGYGLAMFHRLISTLPADQLADTLPGFHITPTYLANYEQILDKRRSSLPKKDSKETQFCLAFIAARKGWATVLEQAKADGHLQLRPIHGDPKVNNIMMGDNGKAVSLIDLDTIKPGLVHYDIGDCLRSGCNPLGEETEDWEQVVFDADLAQAMLQGYLSLAGDFLTEKDYDYLYDGIRLIAFELGLRFFTDYLAGNVYFKVKHPTHNLTRALVQFKLTESIEQQENTLRSIIQELR